MCLIMLCVLLPPASNYTITQLHVKPAPVKPLTGSLYNVHQCTSTRSVREISLHKFHQRLPCLAFLLHSTHFPTVTNGIRDWHVCEAMTPTPFQKTNENSSVWGFNELTFLRWSMARDGGQRCSLSQLTLTYQNCPCTVKDKEGTEVNRWTIKWVSVDTIGGHKQRGFQRHRWDTSTCTPAVLRSTLDRKIVIFFDKWSL